MTEDELAYLVRLHDEGCPDRTCDPMTYAHLLNGWHKISDEWHYYKNGNRTTVRGDGK